MLLSKSIHFVFHFSSCIYLSTYSITCRGILPSCLYRILLLYFQGEVSKCWAQSYKYQNCWNNVDTIFDYVTFTIKPPFTKWLAFAHANASSYQNYSHHKAHPAKYPINSPFITKWSRFQSPTQNSKTNNHEKTLFYV